MSEAEFPDINSYELVHAVLDKNSQVGMNLKILTMPQEGTFTGTQACVSYVQGDTMYTYTFTIDSAFSHKLSPEQVSELYA